MYLITSRLCFASNNQSTVSEERSIKDGFWTKTAGLFPLRSLLAALHFHPCFLTHVSTRSFVGLLRLNWSVKISNKSVVSYEHNNLKSHFMQSVFLESNVEYVKSNATYHGCVLHAFPIALSPSACKASADWPPRCPCGVLLLGFDHSVSQGGFPRGTWMPRGIWLCHFPQESSLNRSLAVSRKAEGEHNGHHGWKTPLTEGWSLSLAVFWN